MHPRNRHTGRYDFEKLTEALPRLGQFLIKNRSNEPTIDFSNPEAVKVFNHAILIRLYGIRSWDIPSGFLCPPIPGRADYIHHLADLLASSFKNAIPRGRAVQVLDVGVGSSTIYPIIGVGEYEWSFLGSEIDPIAFESAKSIVDSNPSLAGHIELRMQRNAKRIFKDLLGPDEVFDATICNPPFHASLEESQEGSRRKWRNLGRDENAARTPKSKQSSRESSPHLNFGGQGSELWTEGGEIAFVRAMIQESTEISQKVLWFTTLVSKESNLPAIYGALKTARALETKTFEMAQGQKKSRIIAWSFLGRPQQEAWTKKRWS